MNALLDRLPAVLAVVAAVGLGLFVWYQWPSWLESRIALRYLKSRRSSRLLSLITVIAVGGVTVGVMALVIVLGVMNGLQADLRDKILVANPHLRVLTYGEGLRLDDWRRVLDSVRHTPGVEAASPFVLTQGLVSAGHDYAEGVVVLGVAADTGHRAVDWQSQNASLFSALKLEKLAMGLVVFLICVVAAFNVVGVLTMVVRDKTREIGILLAMGMRRVSIRRVFLAQGMLIGLTGTVLGALLGIIGGGMVNRGQWIHIDPSIYFVDH